MSTTKNELVKELTNALSGMCDAFHKLEKQMPNGLAGSWSDVYVQRASDALEKAESYKESKDPELKAVQVLEAIDEILDDVIPELEGVAEDCRNELRKASIIAQDVLSRR